MNFPCVPLAPLNLFITWWVCSGIYVLWHRKSEEFEAEVGPVAWKKLYVQRFLMVKRLVMSRRRCRARLFSIVKFWAWVLRSLVSRGYFSWLRCALHNVPDNKSAVLLLFSSAAGIRADTLKSTLIYFCQYVLFNHQLLMLTNKNKFVHVHELFNSLRNVWIGSQTLLHQLLKFRRELFSLHVFAYFGSEALQQLRWIWIRRVRLQHVTDPK